MKEEIRHTLVDGFGNIIILLPTVCPKCLGKKSKYSDKCIKCINSEGLKEK